MKINVKVIPNAKKTKVVKEGDLYKVYINAPAVDGKANEALIEALSEHFKTKKRCINIVFGKLSRNKIIELP